MAESGSFRRLGNDHDPTLPFFGIICYRHAMLKTRIKRRAAEHVRVSCRLADIEASITALADEDLLDLADIFSDPETPLSVIASAEMTKRKISL